MINIYFLAKIKFDLRNPDEIHFAKKEIDSLLNTSTEPIKSLAGLIKKEPFAVLDDELINLMTRLTYLGEYQGYLAEIPAQNLLEIIKKATFFREIYVFAQIENNNKVLKTFLNNIGISSADLSLSQKKIYENPFTQIFIPESNNKNKLIMVRFLPFQTLFEYVTEVKKLPYAVFRPQFVRNWEEYFQEKEKGINKGIAELLFHMNNNYSRAPNFGLGKNHIGDFVDWASTDLRKPFLHYLHKYKGKGDPRISRGLINLLKIKSGDKLLDPFAGSGAFIADAPSMGINAIGVEILNIGKMIAEVKCNLKLKIEDLRNEIINLYSCSVDKNIELGVGDEYLSIKEKLKNNLGTTLPYQNILAHLSKILFLKKRIQSIKNEQVRAFLLVLLSQEIVEYSEKSRNWNIINSFKFYVEDRYLTLYATKKLAEILNIDLSAGRIEILRGDATNLKGIDNNSIDGILTSPPYFDALDYIENNRVSIIILGMEEDLSLGATVKFYDSKFRERRKIKRNSNKILDRYSSIQLPESSRKLIELLNESNRVQKAKTVENYLKMMKISFDECFRVLKKEKYYIMVISKYHKWIINGSEQIINTSAIIEDLGKSVGFKITDIIEHGLSKADKGKIGAENILIFQKQ